VPPCLKPLDAPYRVIRDATYLPSVAWLLTDLAATLTFGAEVTHHALLFLGHREWYFGLVSHLQMPKCTAKRAIVIATQKPATNDL
jgi:hypothetical protein